MSAKRRVIMETQQHAHATPSLLTHQKMPGHTTGLKVKTRIKPGAYPVSMNHNQTVVSGLRVKTHTAARRTARLAKCNGAR